MRKTLLNIGNSYLFTGIVVAIDKDFGYEVLDDEWSADDGTQPHAVTGVENEDYVIASSAQTVAYNPWGKVSGSLRTTTATATSPVCCAAGSRIT